MGEHGGVPGYQRGAVLPDSLIGGGVLPVDGLCLGLKAQEGLPRLLNAFPCPNGALHGPAQVHGRGPGLGDLPRGAVQPWPKLLRGQSGVLLSGQDDPVCSRDADGGGAPHSQLLDSLHDVLPPLQKQVGGLRRQARLVQDAQAPVAPLKGLDGHPPLDVTSSNAAVTWVREDRRPQKSASMREALFVQVASTLIDQTLWGSDGIGTVLPESRRGLVSR